MNTSPNPFIEAKVKEFNNDDSNDSELAKYVADCLQYLAGDTSIIQANSENRINNWLRTALTEAYTLGGKEERERCITRGIASLSKSIPAEHFNRAATCLKNALTTYEEEVKKTDV